MTQTQGYADPGWGAVVDAFQRNFDHHDELGAACCVYVNGRPVVDIWAGTADGRNGYPWGENTVALVFSTTKGPTAICAHLLAERGVLSLDAPVAEYWPEFRAEGKDDLRVRWLLSHQAGLPVIDGPLTLREACAWEPVTRALEKQRPLWEPGTKQSYHAVTYGFLVGEVVRRVTGMTLGELFSDEIAVPLGLSAWIGLPEEIEPRVAHLEPDPTPLGAVIDAMLAEVPDSIPIPKGAKQQLKAMWTDPKSVDARAAELGGAFSDGLLTEDGGHNSRIVRGSEHPASGMVCDARSLARMYAATIGSVDGVRLLNPATVKEACVVPASTPYGVPPELQSFVADAFPAALSLGFMRPTRRWPMLGGQSFGHAGFGGSIGFADPATGVGFGYVMNRLAPNGLTANNLAAAVAKCIA
jgi:CubicO group peptidase (beta-lactamase class C family)